MKKSFKLLILFNVLFCSVINIFAQEKTVTEQEINTLKDTAYEKLKNKSYRVIMTSEGYVSANDSFPNQFVAETVEHISPDRRRSVYERKSGLITFRMETIVIDQKNIPDKIMKIGKKSQHPDMVLELEAVLEAI